MKVEIRKFVTYEEEILHEGKACETPLKLFAVAAVINNPWTGKFVEDMSLEINEFAPILGKELTSRIIKLAGGGDQIEGYGKAAVVGLDGELEHASAFPHTLKFGNHYREAVGAKTYLAFTNVRGGANTPIMIPLMDKQDAGRRSHYLTIQFSISDAPHSNEIVVALGASNGGRPFHRIGDRYQDLKEMGFDPDNPAGV